MIRILDNYKIGTLASYKAIERGEVNYNWIVKTTEGKYILRKESSFKKLPDLEFQFNYLTYLKSHGFPYRIPVPILTKNRKHYIKSNKSYFWLYEYIEGRIRTRFGLKELRQVAKMMAGYHHLIEQLKLDNKKGNSDVFGKKSVLKELTTFRNKVIEKPKKDRKDNIFLKEAPELIRLLKSLDDREYAQLKRYPLHRDITPTNILWKGNKIAGIVDFENVSLRNEPTIKDIAVMLQYSCRDKKHQYKSDLKLSKFFLEEYRKHHSISNEEIKFIPDIITAGAIEDFAYAYWMLVNVPERAKLYRLKLYSNVAKWHFGNRGLILKRLSFR
ncbi:MAG: phosphotransferase [Candidatus Bathyarchaeia archaeon]